MAKILLVEDEILLGMNTRMTLEGMGHTVVGVTPAGKEALEIIESERPELVFMDIVLQDDLSGIDVTRIINEKYDIKVLYMTAHTDQASIDMANQTRHCGFIYKPIEDYQLEEAVNRCLGAEAS